MNKGVPGQDFPGSDLGMAVQVLENRNRRETIAGRSKNLDEIFSIQREENISPSQSRNQNWSILVGGEHQCSINGDHIINKRNFGTQSDPYRRGFKRKFGEIFLNLISNP